MCITIEPDLHAMLLAAVLMDLFVVRCMWGSGEPRCCNLSCELEAQGTYPQSPGLDGQEKLGRDTHSCQMQVLV